uniref:Poly [ADP-ribose] polymerase n=1 Tax=Oncorhynchus tshawytscha TaxID=74940 RepID=A0AAZ3SLX8_ONCTS
MLRVSKPGGKKLFQEKEAMYVEDVFRQTGCVVHLVEKDDQKVQAMENTDQKGFGSHGKSLQRHNHPTFSTQNQHRLIQSRDGSDRVQTKEGLTIILMKGNIQDVVVNTVGLDLLLHSGAVSNAILKAAGPRLQDLINEQGPTGSAAEGAVIITDGCNLKSKLVFHTIAPKWDQGKGAAQKAVTGDITKETTDVIVNSSNSSFSLKSGTLTSIYDHTLGNIAHNSKHKGAEPNEGMIMTKPGNLQCKKIIHLVNQTDTKKIQQSVEGALKMCTQNNFTSISLPAIGTGKLQKQRRERACEVLKGDLSLYHIDVLKQFEETCKKSVLKIERIQNKSLWGGFQIKKKDMEARNGHQNNERKLFHGACHTTIDKINELGFNRSYAGKNAALYGDGTYFAVNAKYSASDKYSKPDPQGQKYMYLCRVLTGDFITGTSGMKVPPTKSTTSINLYDSVTDGVSPPSMFIIFHDSQAYPEYLITFK